MKLYKVTMDNGYVGCTEVHVIEAEDEDEAFNFGYQTLEAQISVTVEEIDEKES